MHSRVCSTLIHMYVYVLILSHHAVVVKIITSNSFKDSLGLAYIWFAHEEDALSAVKHMDGKVPIYCGITFSFAGACLFLSLGYI